MMILLTSIFLFILILGKIRDWDDSICLVATTCLIICLITIILLTIAIVNGRTINQQIAMYTEENKIIENEINVLVEQYMNYESDTYGKLKGKSSITLIALYPELKTNTLVEKQIEVYLANNDQIKLLKKDLINLSNQKWFLYFGN